MSEPARAAHAILLVDRPASGQSREDHKQDDHDDKDDDDEGGVVHVLSVLGQLLMIMRRRGGIGPL